MAIDISSLSRLITDFRAISQKDAISPDSLGYLLQLIANLLATAAEQGATDNAADAAANAAALANDALSAANSAKSAAAAAQSTADAINARLGKPGGIATLGSDGILTGSQRPPCEATSDGSSSTCDCQHDPITDPEIDALWDIEAATPSGSASSISVISDTEIGQLF